MDRHLPTLVPPSWRPWSQKLDREGVRAMFVDTIETSILARAVAAEAGERVEVVEIYTGSLGGLGSGADTLIGMLLTNAQRISAALA